MIPTGIRSQRLINPDPSYFTAPKLSVQTITNMKSSDKNAAGAESGLQAYSPKKLLQISVFACCVSEIIVKKISLRQPDSI